MFVPPGVASATASSVIASSCMRASSDHGDATIGASSWCAPSLSCSIDCRIQRSPARPEGPVLGERRQLVALIPAVDDVAVAVDHHVPEDGGEADDHAVLVVVLAVGEPDVLDRRLLADLAHVVPAAAIEVVEAAHPLGEQIGSQEAGRAPRGRDRSRPRRSRRAARPSPPSPRRRRSTRRRRPPRPRRAPPGARGRARRLRSCAALTSPKATNTRNSPRKIRKKTGLPLVPDPAPPPPRRSRPLLPHRRHRRSPTSRRRARRASPPRAAARRGP